MALDRKRLGYANNKISEIMLSPCEYVRVQVTSLLTVYTSAPAALHRNAGGKSRLRKPKMFSSGRNTIEACFNVNRRNRTTTA